MPVVLPEFASAWPNALVDFIWGVRRYAYLLVTVALCFGLATYLVAKLRPQRPEAYAVIGVGDGQAAAGLQRLLRQDDFLVQVARQVRSDANGVRRLAEMWVQQSSGTVEVHVSAADPDFATDLVSAIVQGWLQASSSGKQVLSPAQLQDPALTDRAGAMALLATAGVLLLGALLAGVHELALATFRMPGDITARLPVLELGTIPDCRPGKDAVQREALIHTAFRSLLQSLWATGKPGKRPRMIVVASPKAGDGRSMVAANLALAFADTSRWVLLIDTNTQTPALHTAFSVSNDWGLADALREETAIDLYDFQHLFKRSAVAGLWVLPTGTGVFDLHTRRAQERLSDLLARARVEFHNVIVDTPPGPAPEVRMLAGSADGVLLVLRALQTTQRSATQLADHLVGDGIGMWAVLNDWRPGVA